MGVLRVEFLPFDDTGNYVADWIDVTEDVSAKSISTIKQTIANNDFDIGIFRTSNIKLNMDNISGNYSDIDQPRSIFNFKRADTQVRVFWNFSAHIAQAGAAVAGGLTGATLGGEVEIYKGLLNDDNFALDLGSHFVNFDVLGRETLFKRVEVPFSGLANGDTFQDILFDSLNQAPITDVLTVTLGNINPGLDLATDDVSDLEGKTVQEMLKDVLLLSGSVLRIEGDDIIVSDASASADVEFEFFGQNSPLGLENVLKLKDVVNGVRRVFNLVQWTDTTVISRDTTSININGVRRKEVSSKLLTSSVKQDQVTDQIVLDFAARKQELKIETPANYDSVVLELLDKVTLDYPVQNVEGFQGAEIPIVGSAIVGTSVLPFGYFDFTDSSLEPYKVIEKKFNVKKDSVELKLRRI